MQILQHEEEPNRFAVRANLLRYQLNPVVVTIKVREIVRHEHRLLLKGGPRASQGSMRLQLPGSRFCGGRVVENLVGPHLREIRGHGAVLVRIERVVGTELERRRSTSEALSQAVPFAFLDPIRSTECRLILKAPEQFLPFDARAQDHHEAIETPGEVNTQFLLDLVAQDFRLIAFLLLAPQLRLHRMLHSLHTGCDLLHHQDLTGTEGATSPARIKGRRSCATSRENRSEKLISKS